jgi:hypothetical protein
MKLGVLIVLIVQIAGSSPEKHEIVRPDMETCWWDAIAFMESLPQDMLEKGVVAGCFLKLAGQPA